MLPTVAPCHCPPRAVRTPRALSASASALLPVMPAACRLSMIGRTLAANWSAPARSAALPSFAASPARGLPSLKPCAFFRASASLVRVLIRARSQADVRRQVLTPGWFGAQSSELSGRTNSLNL
jgi:hypothetical protein